jgi:hypothetical protein
MQVTHAAGRCGREGEGIFLGLSAENYKPSSECGSIFSYQQIHNLKRPKKVYTAFDLTLQRD